MHQKAIKFDGVIGSFGSTGGWHHSKWTEKSRSICWISLLFSIISCFSGPSLQAAPDPDLFDGRVTSMSSAESPDAPAEVMVSETEGVRESNSARAIISETAGRDLDSVGGVGGGQTVESNSSKGGSSRSSVIPYDYDRVKSAEDGGSKSTAGSEKISRPVEGALVATPKTEISGALGSGISGSQPRDFEEFGFGGSSIEETVEVNRSKAGTESLSTGFSSPTGPEIPQTGVGLESGEGTKPTANIGSGDLGTNVPSGL